MHYLPGTGLLAGVWSAGTGRVGSSLAAGAKVEAGEGLDGVPLFTVLAGDLGGTARAGAALGREPVSCQASRALRVTAMAAMAAAVALPPGSRRGLV